MFEVSYLDLRGLGGPRASTAIAASRVTVKTSGLLDSCGLEERRATLPCVWVQAVCQDITFVPFCQIDALAQYQLEPTLV
jgi:hypothetical protein